MTVDFVSQYTVRPGDTLTKISNATGVSVTHLMQMNNIAKPEQLKAGQNLLMVGDSAFGLSQVDIFKSGIRRGSDPQEPDYPVTDITSAVRDMIDFGGKTLRSPDQYAQRAAILTGDNPKTPANESTLSVASYAAIQSVSRGHIGNSFHDVHWLDSEKLLVVKGMGMLVNEKQDMPGGGLSLFDVENDHQTTLVDQFELAGLVKPYFAPASGPDGLAIRRVLKSEAAPGGHRVQTEAFDEKGRKYRLDFAIANQQAKLTNVVIYK